MNCNSISAATAFEKDTQAILDYGLDLMSIDVDKLQDLKNRELVTIRDLYEYVVVQQVFGRYTKG